MVVSFSTWVVLCEYMKKYIYITISYRQLRDVFIFGYLELLVEL